MRNEYEIGDGFSKFQVLIPENIRDSMGIMSGQKMQMPTYRNCIEMIPIKPIRNMKGFLMGIDAEVRRDDDCI